MRIIVHQCSRCGKMHYDASNMRKHIASVCVGATLQKLEGMVILSPETGPSTTVRCKPGPKPVDLHAVLKGRVPAFTDQGDDDRIEYLFDSGLVRTLVTLPIDQIPVFLFEHLWSSSAPITMQSLIMHRNTVYEVDSLDIETGDVTYLARGSMTKRFVKEVAVYMLEFAYAVAKDSIPSRTPDQCAEARQLFEKLCATVDGLTLRDAIKKTEGYTKRSFAIRHAIDRTLGALADCMQSKFPTCFSLSTVV